MFSSAVVDFLLRFYLRKFYKLDGFLEDMQLVVILVLCHDVMPFNFVSSQLEVNWKDARHCEENLQCLSFGL